MNVFSFDIFAAVFQLLAKLRERFGDFKTNIPPMPSLLSHLPTCTWILLYKQVNASASDAQFKPSSNLIWNSFFFSNLWTRKVLVFFKKCELWIYMDMDKTAYPSVPQGPGMNRASLEATGPPIGGPPNDLNLNISSGK